jgi:hypothetical protein
MNTQATLSDTEEEVMKMSVFFSNWEFDDEDDGDSFQVIPEYLINAKVIPTNFLVTSPTGENEYDFPVMVKEQVPTGTKKKLAHPEEINQEVLYRLKQRYKKFIPQSLPPPRKRAGPLCLFINYLGTRRVFIPAHTTGVASLAPMAEEPSSYPTDPPSGYGSHGATMAPPSKRRKISLDPTLQPTENYM